MFQDLSKRLISVLGGLKRQGVIREADLEKAMREMRIALLEADVALPVVKELISRVHQDALGQQVLKSLSPGEVIVKIMHDHIIGMLGGESVPLKLNAAAPVPILMVGLQGSGKTTTCGKLARYFMQKMNKRVYMASLDVYRPAAQQQLEQLGQSLNVGTLPIIAGEKPVDIVKRAQQKAREHVADILLFDTAGRQHMDADMMAELVELHGVIRPTEVMLVLDGMTGQDAVRTAQGFKEKLPLTSLVLTRMDGDAKGGAALSLRYVTDCPIQFLGAGEKSDQFSPFDAKRMADRLLDQGDILALVEHASQAMADATAEEMDMEATIMKGGHVTLEHMLAMFLKVRKMGGVQKMLSMLPGMQERMGQANMDEKKIVRYVAAIQSMTPKERRVPDILNASRKRRIAKGAGIEVMHINQLLQQYQQMVKMTQHMRKTGLLKRFLKK